MRKEYKYNAYRKISKYNAYYIFSRLYLHIIDFFTQIFLKKKKAQINFKNIKKILISNIAHFGDIIISTSILPILKEKYPKAKISFLCGSWNREFLENHHLIDKVFCFDHRKLNRSKIFFLKKLIKHISKKKEAIKKIADENFCLAIDLHYYYPNSIPFLHKAKINTILGYSSAGYKSYLTFPLQWMYTSCHVSQYHINLINLLPKILVTDSQLRACLPKTFDSGNEIINKMLLDDYFVLHMGAGIKKREWAIDKWQQIKETLLEQNVKIIFTGANSHENHRINQVIDDSKNCENLCDKLNMNDLFIIIKNAKMVVTHDTSILHIATAYDVPMVIIDKSASNSANWIMKKSDIKTIKVCSKKSKKKPKHALPMDILDDF